MAAASKYRPYHTLQRSFRDLGREGISESDKMDALEAIGLGAHLTWDDILSSPRVLLVSRAGSGKTYECQEMAKRLFADGKSAFFLALESVLSDEISLLFDPEQSRRFQQWRSNGYSEAYFFLDSVDELLLSHGNFRHALRKFASATDGQLHRAKIVVTSRPIALDLDAFAAELPVIEPTPPADAARDSDEEFRRLINGETREQRSQEKKKPIDRNLQRDIRIVGLTPLDDKQMRQIAEVAQVKDIAGLLSEIDRRRSWDLARRPQELIEICSYWNEYKRLGTRSDQIKEDIRHKLQETGGRARHIRLSDARALEGAERLALAQVLTRKRTIRFSDLSLDTDETEAAIDPSIILHDWTALERTELLQRPLFGSASYGRVRFHHRSASEFLASQRLQNLHANGHMSRSALFRLLFGECYGQKLVFPSMRAVASWLAIKDDAVRDEILHREPEALMDDGDPENFPVNTRARILSVYVERYGRDAWRGVRIRYSQVLRFASADLSPTVRRLWQRQNTSPEVRELLLDLIQAARMEDCRDIASEVAHDPQASSFDRVVAITALAEMSEPGALTSLTASLLSDPLWPSKVKKGVIDPLFPKHLSPNEFVRLLGQIDLDKDSLSDLAWTLPILVRDCTLPDGEVSLLRDTLACLIKESIESVKHWPYYTSKYKHLTPALAALCLRQFDDSVLPPEEWVEAAVIATRLKVDEFGEEKPVEQVITLLRHVPVSWRETIYTAEGRFCAAFIPHCDDNTFRFNISHKSTVGAIKYDDFDWLLETAANTGLDQRICTAAFGDALRQLRFDCQTFESRCVALRKVAGNNRAWLETLEHRLVPVSPDNSFLAEEAEWKKQATEREAEEEKATQTWVDWRQEVLHNPDVYFSTVGNARIVRDFAHILERGFEGQGWDTYWRGKAISSHFNDAIAERVRAAFLAYWRTIKVPLHSARAPDEQSTILREWIHALAGVYAEAEQPGWARVLGREDAETAARLASVELNGLPPWIGNLIEHQPEAVDTTLGEELSAQLNDAINFQFPGLLTDFRRASQPVLEFSAPRVWAWLSTTDATFGDEREQTRMHEHLEQAIDCLLRSSFDRSRLVALAQSRLSDSFGEPFAVLWLTLLLCTAPRQAIELLEQHMGVLDAPTRYSLCETLFAMFDDRRSVRLGLDLSNQDFTAPVLFSLVRLAYAEISHLKDNDRTDGKPFRPEIRDSAQDGRNAVLNALLAHGGAEAWAIKQGMRSDPLFAHFKDRLDQLARAKAASEAESLPLTDRDLQQIDRYGEAPEADRNGMFQIMMDRLTDLQHDIQAHEFSERSILAGIDQEKDMQVWFAKRLQERAREAYLIDREALVVENKETDIRLLSVRSKAQAVIELKLAHKKYSIDDLEKALETQLLGQYMQHDNCRAGCLLLTTNRKRNWRLPDTKSEIDFSTLVIRLQSLATRLEVQMNYQVKLSVVGIDLTS